MPGSAGIRAALGDVTARRVIKLQTLTATYTEWPQKLFARSYIGKSLLVVLKIDTFIKFAFYYVGIECSVHLCKMMKDKINKWKMGLKY